jgi:transposase-like protein
MTALKQRIVAMAKSGTRPKEIIRLTGAHENTVYEAIRTARRRGEDIPPFANVGTADRGKPDQMRTQHHVVLPSRLHSLLRAEAERRNLTTTEAAQRLLEHALLGTVSRDG